MPMFLALAGDRIGPKSHSLSNFILKSSVEYLLEYSLTNPGVPSVEHPSTTKTSIGR
jgi:hypothetical protein